MARRDLSSATILPPPLAVVYIRTPEKVRTGGGVLLARGIPHAGIVPVGFFFCAPNPRRFRRARPPPELLGMRLLSYDSPAKGRSCLGICARACVTMLYAALRRLAGRPFTPLILLLLVLQGRVFFDAERGSSLSPTRCGQVPWFDKRIG